MSITRDLGFIHYFERTGGNTTLLSLHGTGGNEQDLVPIGKMVSSGSNILSPRGNSLDEGFPRFFRRLGEGIFDEEDLKRRTLELANFVQGAAEKYGLDRTKIVALGYSNGANIAASLLLTRPELLDGAILFRVMLPFSPERVPNLSGKKVLLIEGKRDPITPRSRVELLYELFEKCDAQVKLSWIEGASHGLTQGDVDLAKKWFAGKFEETRESR